jgi:hypothetical protein
MAYHIYGPEKVVRLNVLVYVPEALPPGTVSKNVAVTVTSPVPVP